MPGCTSWMGTCPSAKSRTMRSRFVNGAWWKKSSTTDTDDFPFLRQATAARRGIPRKRCRPTPPCLTHPPSCHPPFSPSGRRGLASDSPEGRRFSAAFSVSALASQFVLLGHRHAPWPHGHRRWPPASASNSNPWPQGGLTLGAAAGAPAGALSTKYP